MSDEIRGWLSPEVATAMTNLIRKVKPNVMVEIGVFAGKSLINSALALRENGKGIIYGIDPWCMENALNNMGTGENVGFWNAIDLDAVHYDCVHNVWAHKLDNVVIIRSPSERCHQLFRAKSVEILYVDGGHSEPQSCLDITNYLPKVKKGGYVWLDDVDWYSLQRATRLMSESCDLVSDFGHCHLYRKR